MAGMLEDEHPLRFDVATSSLTSLVSAAKETTARVVPPDKLFEVLQKLQLSIARSERAIIKDNQRRTEEALVDILLKGTAAPIRRLCCVCLVRMYAAGDYLPMFARVANLQSYLATREVVNRTTPELARVGAMECLATLCLANGSQLGSSIAETVNSAIRLIGRAETGVKCAALNLVASAVKGMGDRDRNAVAVQLEALKIAASCAKDRYSDVSVKCAAAGIVRAVASTGGPGLWADVGYRYEEAVRICIAALDDPTPSVRDAYAVALGELAASCKSGAAMEAVRMLEIKKPGKKPVLEKLLAGGIEKCLEEPFILAASSGRHAASAALAQAWITAVSSLIARQMLDEAGLVDMAVKAVGMLEPVVLAVKNVAPAAEQEIGAGVASGEMPHAQACVLYMLQIGVIEQLSETAQRGLLERLAALVSSIVGNRVPVTMTALEALTRLLGVLEEVDTDLRILLYELLMMKLTSACSAVRHQAAASLAALAVAEPSFAAGTLSDTMANLSGTCQRLASMLPLKGGDAPGNAAPVVSEGTKRLINNVHGYSLGVAALLGASTRMPLGIPSQLALQALKLGSQLVSAPTTKTSATLAAEREAGYILLGAAAVVLPQEAMAGQRSELLRLWKPALNAAAAAQLDVKKYLMAGGELEMAMEMWWRAAALEALQAFVAGPLRQASAVEQAQLARSIGQLLQPTLEAICAHPAMQEPARTKSGEGGVFAGTAVVLQLRLLEVYLALPSASSFNKEHEVLVKLCSRSLRVTAGTVKTEVGTNIASSALRQLLNPQDAMLGPWVPGRDPQEDALTHFAGAPGGLAMHPWQIGHGADPTANESTGVGQAGSTGTRQSQPQSLSAALLDAQLRLLGSLLASMTDFNQISILTVMKGAASGGTDTVDASTTKRPVRDEAKHQAVVVSVCSAAIAGLTALVAKSRSSDDNKVAQAAMFLGEAVLNESGESAALQRAVAEIFALAGQIGSDVFATFLVKQVIQNMAETSSPQRRAALALSAGSIHRKKGGMAMRSTIGLTVETMLAVGRSSSNPVMQIWVAHGLWLTANAAGLSYVPHVQATLDFAVQLLMSEAAFNLAGLRPAMGRLANAMVAALGPELQVGSPVYKLCKSIIREMQPSEVSASQLELPEDVVGAQLETVLYAQMLVLFAPHTVQAASLLPLLLITLASRQPSLRRAAAANLRHLAERDPDIILPERIEGALITALDNENDSAIAAQIQATLQTLLRAGASSAPSYWLSVCSSVALAAPPSAGFATDLPSGGNNDNSLDADGDDDDEWSRGPRPAPAPPVSAATVAGESALGSSLRMTAMTTPRLRTRMFAARCVLELPLAVGSDPRHFNLVPVEGSATTGTGDWLVAQLQLLVGVAFKMTTGHTEALRPLGLRLLGSVLYYYRNAADPMVDGCRLLEQYQAQFVSALRSSLAAGAGPMLCAAGAVLAAAFLQAGLAEGDPVVLSRLMGLLTLPLINIEADCAAEEKQYAEWVGVRARVSLLEAHAQCAVYAATQQDVATRELITSAQKPHLRQLLDKWASLLADAAVSASGPDVAAAHRPLLFMAASSSALHTVEPYLRRAWPSVLDALTLSMQQNPAAAQGAEQLQELQPWLLSVCHMAIADASYRLAGLSADGQGSQAAQSGTTGDADDVEASPSSASDSLLAALTALPRVMQQYLPASADSQSSNAPGVGEEAQNGERDTDAEMEASVDTLGLLLKVIKQVLQPLVKSQQQQGQNEERITWPALLAAATFTVAAIAENAPGGWFSHSAFREGLAEAAAAGAGLASPMQALRSGIAPTQHLDAMSPLKKEQLATALSASFSAASALLKQSPTADVSAERVAFIGIALQVLHNCNLPSNTTAAREFLTAVLVYDPESTIMPQGDRDGGINGNGSCSGGLAASVVANLAAAIKKLSFDSTEGSAARLEALVSTVMSIGAAAPCEVESTEVQEEENLFKDDFYGNPGNAIRQQCLQVLRESQSATAPSTLRVTVLSSLRLHLQTVAADTNEGQASRQAWALQCIYELAPAAGAHVHRLLGPAATRALDHSQIQAVVGTLKMLLVALSVVTDAGGPEPQRALLDLLLSLLIEAAAPESVPASPALTDVALKLISHLASGLAAGSAAGFRSAVAALQPSAKQRLQTALKGLTAAGRPGTGKVPSATAHKPAIALKNFSMAR